MNRFFHANTFTSSWLGPLKFDISVSLNTDNFWCPFFSGTVASFLSTCVCHSALSFWVSLTCSNLLKQKLLLDFLLLFLQKDIYLIETVCSVQNLYIQHHILSYTVIPYFTRTRLMRPWVYEYYFSDHFYMVSWNFSNTRSKFFTKCRNFYYHNKCFCMSPRDL